MLTRRPVMSITDIIVIWVVVSFAGALALYGHLRGW